MHGARDAAFVGPLCKLCSFWLRRPGCIGRTQQRGLLWVLYCYFPVNDSENLSGVLWDSRLRLLDTPRVCLSPAFLRWTRLLRLCSVPKVSPSLVTNQEKWTSLPAKQLVHERPSTTLSESTPVRPSPRRRANLRCTYYYCGVCYVMLCYVTFRYGVRCGENRRPGAASRSVSTAPAKGRRSGR